MDCLESCKKGAVVYTLRKNANAEQPKGEEKVDTSRKNFLVSAGLLAASAVKAQEMKLDGGYATIIDKKPRAPFRTLTPAGSLSAKNMADHCTGCQLCVAVCPNKVLSPSPYLENFMQPAMSFEKGYCRPECTKCSEVCPAGAIRPILQYKLDGHRIIAPGNETKQQITP